MTWRISMDEDRVYIQEEDGRGLSISHEAAARMRDWLAQAPLVDPRSALGDNEPS